MKLYTYLGFFLGCLIATGYVYAAQKAATRAGKEYVFTLENKISTHKLPIYAAVYEKFGTSRWKQVKSPFPLKSNASHTFSLSEEKKYVYAVAASQVMLSTEIISKQEKKALDAKKVNKPKDSNSVKDSIKLSDFTLKNPLAVGVISLTNDYVAPIFIARYVFNITNSNAPKNKLQVDLASIIQRCESKQTIDIAVPIGYQGADVLLIAARSLDTLTATLTIEKAPVLISRSSFENLKKDAPKKSYNASALFANNDLTVVNDTPRDWTIGIYGKKNQMLQLLSAKQLCGSGKKSLFNKNFFLPVSQYDYSSIKEAWVLFDTDDTKITPTLTLNHTLHGGTVARETKTVNLSKWFVEHKKSMSDTTKAVEVQEEAAAQNPLEKDETSADGAAHKDSKTLEKEGALQDAIKGTFNCSLRNDTSKDIFAALYKQEKKQYLRREKPLKAALESSVEIGFEEKELLAFSVSHLELKESLSTLEWNSLNSVDPKDFNEKESKIQQSDFKKEGSFDLAEITLKNDSYSDIAVGRYEYKDRAGKRGKLTLCGVVQAVPKKSFDVAVAQEPTDDVAAPANETPNFALPQGYKGFLGYKSIFDEKNFSSDLPESIDAIIDFRMAHLGHIDSSQAIVFDIEKDLTGEGLLAVENDFKEGEKWVALYTVYDSPITLNASQILPKTSEQFIPYQEQMKLVVKERDFNASMPLQAPYGEILVNTAERLSCKLTEAQMVTAQADTDRALKKEQALKIAAMLKQKQQQAAQDRYRKIEVPQKAKKQRKRFTEPKQEKIEAAIIPQSSRPFVPKVVSPRKPKEISCSATQVRIKNNSGKAITVRFYYRGMFDKSMASHGTFYGIPGGDEACLDLPKPAYFDSRYIVVEEDDADLKESYSTEEVSQMVKDKRAFNVEKEKMVTINSTDKIQN